MADGVFAGVNERWSEYFAVGHLHFSLFEWVRPCGIDHKSVDCFPNERRRFSAATPPDYRQCRSVDSSIDQVPAKDKQLHMKPKKSINLATSGGNRCICAMNWGGRKIIGSCRHTSRPLTGWIICIDTFTKWFPDKFNALSWPRGTSSSYGISPISAIDNDFKRWSNFSNETKNEKERKHLIIILSHFGNQISRPTFGFARQPKRPKEHQSINGQKWSEKKGKTHLERFTNVVQIHLYVAADIERMQFL